MSIRDETGPMPVAEPHVVAGADPEAVLRRAAVALTGVEQEIADLWGDAVGGVDGVLSDRLVEVGHALHRASRVLGQATLIGSAPSAPRPTST